MGAGGGGISLSPPHPAPNVTPSGARCYGTTRCLIYSVPIYAQMMCCNGILKGSMDREWRGAILSNMGRRKQPVCGCMQYDEREV